MAIDTSMYQNFRLPDFVGSYMEGKEFRQRQDDRKKAQSQSDAMKGIYKLGPDGKMTIDHTALQQFAQVNPEGAYKIQSDLDEQKFKRDQLNAMRAQKTQQSAELSASQAKQLGLANMGIAAEGQYQAATAPNDEYDPTSPMEFIDNSTWAPAWLKSDKANQASSSQATWVENFLRDASGAAIPPSERHAYAKDYFPRPGDSPQVVANKQRLREQKMKNALVGSGLTPQQVASVQFPKQQAPAQKGGSSGGWGANEAHAGQPKVLRTNDIDWAD